MAARRLSEEIRYLRMGLGLTRLGADLRSRLLLAALSLPGVDAYQARPGAAPVTVRLRLKQQTFTVGLQNRTDLDVLHEIGMDDEYGAADAVAADTIVDLGAHIGLGTLRLLAGHPGARVIAVEADPWLAQRLRANVCGLPVTVVQAAIGATDGERTFFRSEGGSWANSVARVSPDQVEVTVPSMTLTHLRETYGIDQIDLLKIDVEGAEWELLADGLPDGIGALMAEFHIRDGRPPHELMAALSSALAPTVVRETEDQLVFFARTERETAGTMTTI